MLSRAREPAVGERRLQSYFTESGCWSVFLRGCLMLARAREPAVGERRLQRYFTESGCWSVSLRGC